MWAKAWFEMARAQRLMRTTAPRTASAALVSAPLALAGSAHTAAPRTLTPLAGNGPEKHAATHGSSASASAAPLTPLVNALLLLLRPPAVSRLAASVIVAVSVGSTSTTSQCR